MDKRLLSGLLSALLLSGCGLESLVTGLGHSAYDRPASAFRGATSWSGAAASQLSVIDGDGNTTAAFQTSVSGGRYDLRLPSSTYNFVRVQGRAGNMLVRALVPFVGKESAADNVDLDARSMTESLIVEARLSASGKKFKQLTPAAYAGTHALIRRGMDQPGPTQDLLNMVSRIMTQLDINSGSVNPDFFSVPVLNPDFTTKSSALDAGWLVRNRFAYLGNGVPQADSTAFDATLSQAAQLYKPEGCPDPSRIRVVFTVDFNQGALNGNCGASDRFKWATDKPGKSMYFVGWVHKDSPIQDPAVNSLLGASTPNTIPMHDDGTNGDEVAGDNIWTVAFDLPIGLRVGYKYTWGFQGQVWTGSEEWPGNSRILEIVDVNGDGFVYRRDVFADEATNKDFSNLSLSPLNTGSITWTTDLRGCGPEAREQKVTLHNACKCDAWITPQSLGPLTVSCTGP